MSSNRAQQSVAKVDSAAPSMGCSSGSLLLVIFVVGLGLRVLAATSGDLWLDEIWTFGPDVVGKIRRSIDVFVGIHHENNHYLNTLFAWLSGPNQEPLIYRLPSVLGGVASIWFAARIGGRRSHIAGLFAATLICTSYLLVHYGSEARGYSMMVCAALASWDFRERLRARPSVGTALGAALAECLGVASQPVFVCYLAAVGLISLKESLSRSLIDRRSGVWQTAAAVPASAWFVFLYMFDLQFAFNPGGELFPMSEVSQQTLSLIVGGPYEGAWLWLGGLVGGLGLTGAWLTLWRTDRRWCQMSLLAGLLIPVAVIVAQSRNEVYPRYFLIGAALGQITLALAAAQWWHRGGIVRHVATLTLCGLIVGQLTHVERLVRLGRGDPAPLIERLATESAGRIAEYTTDQDFRIRTLIERGAARQSSVGFRVRLVPAPQARRNPPEWLIVHDFRVKPEFPGELRIGNVRYDRRVIVPYAGLSGWTTALYRRNGQ